MKHPLYLLILGALFAAPAAMGQNLIDNPGFEDGNTLFFSEYAYVPTNADTNGDCDGDSMYEPYTYTIGVNPRNHHTGWATFGDHTSGVGNMMIVNAAAQLDGSCMPAKQDVDVIWEQNVSLNPGAPYEFSYWVALSFAANPPVLQVLVNDVEIGRFDATAASVGSWIQVIYQFDAPAENATITFIDLRPKYSGDDYALDDLSLVALTIPVVINVHPNSDPNPLNLNSGGTTPVAILGSAEFDVYDIDISTLTLASSQVKVVGKSDRALCAFDDIGGYDPDAFDKLGYPDGYDDLVCHFVTAEITPTVDGDNTTVEVGGNLYDGTAFAGSDFVKVVKQ